MMKLLILAESLWGMGGTNVTNECHLFDWKTPLLCKKCARKPSNYPKPLMTF